MSDGKWGERDAIPNTTARYGEQRVPVRRFRGELRIEATNAESTQIRIPLDAREALIVVDGEERWVPVDQLSELAATK